MEKKKLSDKTAVYPLMTVLLGLTFINCMPDVAQALERVPVLGSVIRLVDVRTYQLGWGDTSFTAELPVLETASSTAEISPQEPSQSSLTTEEAIAEPEAAQEPTTEAETFQSSQEPTSETETSQSSQEPESQPSSPVEEVPEESPQEPSQSSPATEEAIAEPEAAQEPTSETETSQSSQESESQSSSPVEEVPEESSQEPPSDTESDQPSFTEPVIPNVPAPSDPSNGADDMNRQMEEYIVKVREAFL